MSAKDNTHESDAPLRIGDIEMNSRLLVGTGKYASFAETRDALEITGTEMVTVAIPDTQATYTAETLAEIAQSVGALASAAPSVEEALSKITKDSTAPVRVLICGSLYLAGHVLGRASDGAAAA